jgi:YARHG domain
MTRFKLIGLALIGLTATEPAFAACPELWFERNAIYDDNGYCFKTEKGRATFDNSDCWTTHPTFSKWETKRIKAIKREERLQGCTPGGNSAPG